MILSALTGTNWPINLSVSVSLFSLVKGVTTVKEDVDASVDSTLIPPTAGDSL